MEKLDLRWSVFEYCNIDKTQAFEDMCRRLFTEEYLKGKTIPHSDHNMPGIEVIPILEPEREDGQPSKRISFQSKYHGNVSDAYKKFKESAEKTVENWQGDLDLVYLFSNQTLTTKSSKYKEIVRILAEGVIEAIPVTNTDLLDLAAKYPHIAKDYFEPKSTNTDISSAPTTTIFKRYYELVKRKFTRKKRGVDAELVGAYSDEEAYIDAYITVNDKRESVLSYLENWFCEDTFGTMLIYGEPGHGKTSLCNKAVFEYCKGDFLTNKATNVLTVSLNTGDNPRIIEDGMVVLENALTWKGEKKSFTFEDCQGALLFMDGYDEFIDEAKKTNIKDIVIFMKLIDGLADKYDVHIVVLSRTIAVERHLKH